MKLRIQFITFEIANQSTLLMNEFRSDFLFPTEGLITGIGSVLDINGTYVQFNYSDSDQEADTKALRNDWENVAGHVSSAFEKIKESKGVK